MTGRPRSCEEGHVQGGELEVVAEGEADQVGVGGVFVRGLGRIAGAQIVGEKTMGRAGIEADRADETGSTIGHANGGNTGSSHSAAVKTPHEQTALDRQISATDAQIDRLVYDLYGLTEEEIALVEGA
jgi:hypothetical protein